MLIWTLQTTTISIIMIFLVHHLIIFFKTTLTVPKIKDLVNAPTKKYENIYNTIGLSKNIKLSELIGTDDKKSYEGTTNINDIDIKTEFESYIPLKPDLKSMKDELKNFLKNKIKNEPVSQYNKPIQNYSSY
jgi:hypothetical protein